MAYMNQEKKKIIAAELKKVMPKNWKYSLRVDNYSMLTLTIRSAPVDILALCTYDPSRRDGHANINHFYVESAFEEGEVRDTFVKIRDAMNTGNHDNSDPMTDYFDVGHYIDIKVGDWDNAFVVTE